MIFSNKTYRKIISVSILSAYILVSALSLLHYHKIDLNRPDSISSSGNNSFSGLGTFEGQHFVCTIHQNFLSLHNTYKIDSTNHSPDLQYCDSITFIEKVSYRSLLKFNNISLRAPPLTS